MVVTDSIFQDDVERYQSIFSQRTSDGINVPTMDDTRPYGRYVRMNILEDKHIGYSHPTENCQTNINKLKCSRVSKWHEMAAESYQVSTASPLEEYT